MADQRLKESIDGMAGRAVQPNVTLDQKGMTLERSEKLRRNRSAAKGSVTKKIKELTELKLNLRNENEAQMKLLEFNDVVNKFYVAHEVYHATLQNDCDLEDSDEYLYTETRRIENFQQTLKDWITSLATKQLTLETEVESGDSASNIVHKSRMKSRSSITSSRRSKAESSTRSSIANAIAKKAGLVAEAAALNKHQALEEEELRLRYEELAQQRRQEEERLRLKQKRQQLQLETEIAKAEAEERAYAMAELGENYQPLQSPQLPLPKQAISSHTDERPHFSVDNIKAF